MGTMDQRVFQTSWWTLCLARTFARPRYVFTKTFECRKRHILDYIHTYHNRFDYLFTRLDFIICFYTITTDPKLPAVLYENALDKMLQEVEGMIQSVADGEEKVPVEVSTTTGGSSGHLLKDAAATQLLNALRAWGPTSAIRERIKLHNKYYISQL